MHTHLHTDSHTCTYVFSHAVNTHAHAHTHVHHTCINTYAYTYRMYLHIFTYECTDSSMHTQYLCTKFHSYACIHVHTSNILTYSHTSICLHVHDHKCMHMFIHATTQIGTPMYFNSPQLSIEVTSESCCDESN